MQTAVVIPSKGRAGECLIFKKVIPEIIDTYPVYLVVEPQEEGAYRAAYPQVHVVTLPENNQGIGYSRKWIQERFKENLIIMIDDDTEEYRQRCGKTAGGFPKLRRCHSLAAIQALEQVAKENKLACVSFVAQNWQMNPNDPVDYKPRLMWNTVGLHPDLLKAGVIYDIGSSSFEDYEITAQAILKGFVPATVTEYGFNTSVAIGALPGGLQTFDRTELNKRSIEYIYNKYPHDVLNTLINKKSGRPEIRFKWRNLQKLCQK